MELQTLMEIAGELFEALVRQIKCLEGFLPRPDVSCRSAKLEKAVICVLGCLDQSTTQQSLARVQRVSVP